MKGGREQGPVSNMAEEAHWKANTDSRQQQERNIALAGGDAVVIFDVSRGPGITG